MTRPIGTQPCRLPAFPIRIRLYFDPKRAQALIEATRLMRQVQGMLRLAATPAFDADTGTPALQTSLARAAGMTDFTSLRETLESTARRVHAIFIEMIEQPANALPPAAPHGSSLHAR